MSTIVLKTARRNTRVSRLKVRQAVAAIYSEKGTIPVITIKKKAPVKKAAALK